MSALLLVVFGAAFSWSSWKAENARESLYLSSFAELNSRFLDSYFADIESELDVLGQEILETNGLKNIEHSYSLLNRFKKANPDLIIVNANQLDGQILVSTEVVPGQPLPSLAKSASFILARDELLKGGTINIGRPFIGPLAKDWIIPIRYGVRDKAGNLVFMLGAVLPLARQQNLWKNLSLPENTAIGILRDDAYLLSRYPAPGKENFQEIYAQPRTGILVDFLRENKYPDSGLVAGFNSVAKENYNFAFHRLAHYPLTLFVTMPSSNVRAIWWKRMQFPYILLALLLAGSYGVYRWTARRQLAWEVEREESEAQIEFMAYHDALTNLPNRLLAQDHMQLAMAHADRTNTQAALLFLDLDHFKRINDSLGHSIGDAFLKAVAERLRECVRNEDTLSRQGGDEFLVVLSDVHDADSIARVSEKIMGALVDSFAISGHELTTSLSIGIAVYPNDGKDFDTLLKKADTAMYHAKEAGRNTYRFFTEQMNVEAVEHLSMRNCLGKALERGEFMLYYQPQVDLASGAVIGVEALIRLNHPELGMVPPGRFIPVAEDSGLIVAIGQWVLQEACRQAVVWHQMGLPDLVVAVNLSAVQFKRGDLELTVAKALAESGLDPACLELELTESILIQDAEKILNKVRSLKSLGVKLSIDDFGTGYSSLSYLKRFNVDKLKIDQSFVRDLASDPEDAAIVRAIIQMASSLNIKTIAEGVEDERQLDFLRLHHCDEAQGYHFARPMPPDECTRYLAAAKHGVFVKAPHLSINP